jgi:hypothetical protein
MKVSDLLAAALVACLFMIKANAQSCPVTETEKVEGSGLCFSRGQLNATKCQEHCKKQFGNELTEAVCSSEEEHADCRPNCVCKLKCHNANCWGDPHCTSFDGIKFDYQGLKKYYLLKPCKKYQTMPNFELRQSNRPWQGGVMAIMDIVELVVPEWEKILEVKAPDAAGATFVLTVNGRQRDLPYQYPSPDADSCSSNFIKASFKDAAKTQLVLETSFGLRVTLTAHPNANPTSTYTDLSVDIPRHPELKQKACGLLGRPNDVQKDDFVDSNGKEQTPQPGYGPFNWAFGDSWIVPGSGAWNSKCFRDDADKQIEEHNNNIDPAQKKRAEEICKENLENPALVDCAKKLGRSLPDVEACVFDVMFMKSESERKEMVKAMLKTFATACDKEIPFKDSEPCCPTNLGPLYRLYSKYYTTHYYTPSIYHASVHSALDVAGRYFMESSPGRVANSAKVCECQLTRVISMLRPPVTGLAYAHFYTTDPAEAAVFSKKTPAFKEYNDHDWYCAKTPQCGATVPLRRYALTNGAFIYSTNPKEGAKIVAGGHKDEGILCYIWPHSQPAVWSKMQLYGIEGGDYN